MVLAMMQYDQLVHKSLHPNISEMAIAEVSPAVTVVEVRQHTPTTLFIPVVGFCFETAVPL